MTLPKQVIIVDADGEILSGCAFNDSSQEAYKIAVERTKKYALAVWNSIGCSEPIENTEEFWKEMLDGPTSRWRLLTITFEEE